MHAYLYPFACLPAFAFQVSRLLTSTPSDVYGHALGCSQFFSPLSMKWLEYANHAAILSCLCSLPDNYMIKSCYDVKTHKAASDSRWKTHRARSWHAIPVPWQYQNVWATRNRVTESCTLQQPLRSFYTLHLTCQLQTVQNCHILDQRDRIKDLTANSLQRVKSKV